MYGSAHTATAMAAAGAPLAYTTVYATASVLWHIVITLTLLAAATALWRLLPRAHR